MWGDGVYPARAALAYWLLLQMNRWSYPRMSMVLGSEKWWLMPDLLRRQKRRRSGTQQTAAPMIPTYFCPFLAAATRARRMCGF